MRIEFDPAKDATNQTKHGVSLALAGELDWEAALVWVDDRFEYGDLRMIALAPKTGILYVAFVERGKMRRIISLRLANRREVTHYAKNI
ncbi:MAG TPA: BrnT family toxin [Burkholderiales bacterium]|nr:BrnT family toxin [Burkholderiales bacterium]